MGIGVYGGSLSSCVPGQNNWTVPSVQQFRVQLAGCFVFMTDVSANRIDQVKSHRVRVPLESQHLSSRLVDDITRVWKEKDDLSNNWHEQ